MNREPRLQFTDAERQTAELKEPIRKAEKAAEKADKARKKIPKKKITKRTVDPESGKVTVRLCFEEKKAPSKLSHAVTAVPSAAILHSTHRMIEKQDESNPGIDSAHLAQRTAEGSVRLLQEGRHSHGMKPYRNAKRAERKLADANLDVLYQKQFLNNTSAGTNPLSKWQQKRAIRKQYAAAKRTADTAKRSQKTVEAGRRAAKQAKKEAYALGRFLWRHRNGAMISGAIAILIGFMLQTMSAGFLMLQSAGPGAGMSTFPCEDQDMLDAEAAYSAMETELQEKLDQYEETHTYDEYRYELDEIKHDPYVLISLLTAYHGGPWVMDEVQDTMQMFFEKQYILTETVEKETRYRTEIKTGTGLTLDPLTGVYQEVTYQYEEKVPYEYSICSVALENFNLSHVPIYIMGEQQLSMYAAFMSTHGNRPDLFPQSLYPHASVHKDYLQYEVREEYLRDDRFANMLKVAEKYLGYPYIWGGYCPATSFDCSGYISWVINHSGWNVGRLGADSLCSLCTPVSDANVRPGDLVFFIGTYDTDWVSHVGMYVGDNMMIHCGNPISYCDLTDQYWQEHFYCYGRLPEP